MSAFDRRLFLRQVGLASLPLLGGAQLFADSPATPVRLVRGKDPLNLEFPFERLGEFKTPIALHYIRNHYAVPKIDPKTWRLTVTGAVTRALKLSLDDLHKLKEVTLPITLECAGNGRLFLSPKVKGVQWAQGAVSTAEWTGVPLAAILDLAGVEAGAVEVILDGADRGDPKKEMQPPEDITFCRSLPIDKANKPETILAWGMNGAALPPDHGYPLRAIVGGWYGMASVKWVSRIIVTKKPFWGFDQTIDYSYWARGDDGLPRLTPITEMEVKASIARPSAGETIQAGKAYRIHGAAWAGESDVTRVEVSTDAGKSWSAATLLGKAVPFCWRLWEYRWTPRMAGNLVVLARASDRRGRVQPLKHDPGRRSYMISFARPTPVTIRG
jgi:DMSO/TMAO reductase YedYZ molybdopterin-dependent catalytic subunit